MEAVSMHTAMRCCLAVHTFSVDRLIPVTASDLPCMLLEDKAICYFLLQTDLQAKMGVRIVVLDPTPGCPASSVAVQIVGSFRDSAAVKQIAQLVSACKLIQMYSAYCKALMHSCSSLPARICLVSADGSSQEQCCSGTPAEHTSPFVTTFMPCSQLFMHCCDDHEAEPFIIFFSISSLYFLPIYADCLHYTFVQTICSPSTQQDRHV